MANVSVSRFLELAQRVGELEARMAALESAKSAPAPTIDDGYKASGLAANVIETLKGNGYATLAQAQAASDEALMAIPGIGKATVTSIKSA